MVSSFRIFVGQTVMHKAQPLQRFSAKITSGGGDFSRTGWAGDGNVGTTDGGTGDLTAEQMGFVPGRTGKRRRRRAGGVEKGERQTNATDVVGS